VHLISDYLAAVRALKAGPREMKKGSGVNGGMTRCLAMHNGLKCISQVSNVKAHQNAEELARATPTEAKRARGN
jgi:hypothetical protein